MHYRPAAPPPITTSPHSWRWAWPGPAASRQPHGPLPAVHTSAQAAAAGMGTRGMPFACFFPHGPLPPAVRLPRTRQPATQPRPGPARSPPGRARHMALASGPPRLLLVLPDVPKARQSQAWAAGQKQREKRKKFHIKKNFSFVPTLSPKCPQNVPKLFDSKEFSIHQHFKAIAFQKNAVSPCPHGKSSPTRV